MQPVLESDSELGGDAHHDAKEEDMNARLSIVLLGAALIGSSIKAQGSQIPTPAVAAQPEYSLKILGRQAEVTAGSEIRVEVVFTNVSDHQLLVEQMTKKLDQADIHYKTFVYDEKGNLAPETKYGRRIRTGKDEPGETTIDVSSATLRYLQPGQSRKEEIILNKLYDMKQPGKYTVHVEGFDEPVVKSNTITVTVTK